MSSDREDPQQTQQIIVRIQEDTNDMRNRRLTENNHQLPTDPEARLLDLRTVYQRVNKPAMWKILVRHGLRGSF